MLLINEYKLDNLKLLIKIMHGNSKKHNISIYKVFYRKIKPGKPIWKEMGITETHSGADSLILNHLMEYKLI